MYTDNKKNNSNILNICIYVIIALIVIVLIIFLFLTHKEGSKKENFILTEGDIVLNYKEEYIEPGYSYIDKDGIDKTSFVNVTNNVDITRPGVYEIMYEYNGNLLTRKVTILEPASYDIHIEYNIEPIKYTNSMVTVNYKITGETFVKANIPNMDNGTNSEGSFTVSENGEYNIIAYNIKDEEFSEKIIITNIDKEKPNGTCKATINIDNTEIVVNATDNNSITKYEYYNGDNLLFDGDKNSYKVDNKKMDNVNVKVYDEAGNFSDIKCEIIDKSFYEPITPNASESIIFSGNTDTLKVYISKFPKYYLTRIWTKDAYTQLNKAVSPEYGVNLYRPVSLLNKEVTNKNLQNKLIISFNASGFYLKDTYDAYSVKMYSAYDRTSVGTIVINNGVVVRNAYNHAVKQWYLTGIDKNNKMVVFEDNNTSSSYGVTEKQKWAQSVIDSGIRNTYSFAGPVILNGQKLTSFSSSMPDAKNETVKGLQLICQINENNYALFTSKGETRNNAINVFLGLGCKTAVNLDGGGSTSLLYKDKNSTEFQTVVGGARQLPEVGYFVE